jgi:regulator of sigma E protease
MEDALRTVVTVVLFFLILGSLVLIHEFGHFVTARRAGVRVLEFGIGFPPRAKVLRSKGETLYTLNWLPIGGFVKLEGEDGDEADDPRSFASASLPVRLVILAAGVFMNLLTAFLIFLLIAWLATPFRGVRFFDVQPASPASAAGLQAGEAILAVDGREYEFFGESDLLGDLRAHTGETVVLTVQRLDGSVETVPATLRTQKEIDDSPRDENNLPTKGPLGISGGPQGFETVFYGNYSRDLPSAIAIAAQQTVHWFGLILTGLGDLVSGFINNPTAAPPVAGPIGIATQISDIFYKAGPIMTLYVAGVLSANLALVNSLPFPPLDGGRALMIVLKRVFGARISLRAERMTYVVGFAVLMAFLIWVSGFDIARLLGGDAT